jgi:hypothetical protein
VAAGSEIAPYVSASSVMLAAFGFFYNSLKDRIEAGNAVGAAAADPLLWKRQVRTVRSARAVARLLAGVAVLVWLLFLKQVIDEVRAAADVDFSLAQYSTLDVVFVVLATAWLPIGALMGLQARRLTSTLATLEHARPREA